MPFCCYEQVERETLDPASLEKPAWRPCLDSARCSSRGWVGTASACVQSGSHLALAVALSQDRLREAPVAWGLPVPGLPVNQ